MTNGQRIRAMTDEELAQFLCDFRSEGDSCSNCIALEFCTSSHIGMIDWLQQSATDTE